jgi:hypothetical protein
MTRLTRARFRVGLVMTFAALASGCENLSTGPSLSNVALSAFTKQATTDERDQSLCCCRAVGTVTNRNTVPVYVSLTITAFDLNGSSISRALFFVPDVAPGQTAPIDAPGFLVPCVGISRFEAQVKIRGLTDPPL